ncbi:MAG: AbrB/MazE/SpoVT family DNA-binding domain-containing protein [Actinomycetota bacterium]
MQSRIFVNVQARGQLILPAGLRKRLHLNEPGAQVEIVERPDGVVELHPQAPVPAGQRWFWEESWQKGEKLVDRQVAEGKVMASSTPEEFFDELEAVRGESKSRGA